MTTELDNLRAPFKADEIKFYAAALTQDKKKGKVAPYADARVYMDRLDSALGPANWSTAYEVLDQTRCAVECRLSIRIGDEWITKANVGYPNEGKDASNADKEPLKAAYSDALKRACVEWGVGRFLYDMKLKQDWLPVDEWGRFTQPPVILGQGEKAAPPDEGEPPATVAKTKQDLKQMGRFVTEDGRFDADKWAQEFTPVRQAVQDITGGDMKKWLKANPQKSLDDLLDMTKEKVSA